MTVSRPPLVQLTNLGLSRHGYVYTTQSGCKAPTHRSELGHIIKSHKLSNFGILGPSNSSSSLLLRGLYSFRLPGPAFSPHLFSPPAVRAIKIVTHQHTPGPVQNKARWYTVYTVLGEWWNSSLLIPENKLHGFAATKPPSARTVKTGNMSRRKQIRNANQWLQILIF